MGMFDCLPFEGGFFRDDENLDDSRWARPVARVCAFSDRNVRCLVALRT